MDTPTLCLRCVYTSPTWPFVDTHGVRGMDAQCRLLLEHDTKEEAQAARKHTELFGQEFQIMVSELKVGSRGGLGGLWTHAPMWSAAEESHIGPQ